MGKRSRKRISDDVASGTTRAERDAARVRRVEAAKLEGKPLARTRPGSGRRIERPPAPWGRFPLTELVVVLAIVMFVLAFAVFGIETPRGSIAFVGGLVLGMLAGMETAIREHFSGYRSHSTLLAAIIAVVVMVAITALLQWLAPLTPKLPALAGTFLVGAVVFSILFPAFRRAFAKRSGGKPYR
jgi:hypothetical protein